jgi:hypothetical protein
VIEGLSGPLRLSVGLHDIPDQEYNPRLHATRVSKHPQGLDKRSSAIML